MEELMGSAVVQKGAPVVADGHIISRPPAPLPLRPEAGGRCSRGRRPPGRSAMPSTTTAEKAELRRRARQYLRELSPQARRASDDALFARFLALPQVEGGGYPAALPRHGGRARHRPPPPRPLGAGQTVCLPRCLPGHGLEARLVRPDSALIPHPYGMEAGRTAPWWVEDAIAACWCPVWPSTPPAVVWARGAVFMTAGWRITPAVPPPCAGRRCCAQVPPRPPTRGWS